MTDRQHPTSSTPTTASATTARPTGTGRLPELNRLAPDVDPAWREELVLELRLLAVPGDRIGDALATVEEHVVESGETATEAFGDPRAYARTLAQETGDAGRGWRINGLTVASAAAGLLGMLASVRGLTAVLEHTRVSLTVGDAVSLGIVLVLLAAFLASATAVLRVLVRRRVLAALTLPLLFMVGLGLPLMAFRRPLVDLPALPLLLAGLVLVALGAVLSWYDVSPVQETITGPGQRPAPGSERSVRLISALTLPAMTLMMLLLTWGMSSTMR